MLNSRASSSTSAAVTSRPVITPKLTRISRSPLENTIVGSSMLMGYPASPGL